MYIRKGEEIPEDVCQFCGKPGTDDEWIWGAITLLPNGDHLRDLYHRACARKHNYSHSLSGRSYIHV